MQVKRIGRGFWRLIYQVFVPYNPPRPPEVDVAMTPTLQEIMARSVTPGRDQAKWRTAFDYANRTNAIEGLPPPLELGLQVQQCVIEGRATVDEAVAVLVKYYAERTHNAEYLVWLLS